MPDIPCRKLAAAARLTNSQRVVRRLFGIDSSVTGGLTREYRPCNITSCCTLSLHHVPNPRDFGVAVNAESS